MQFQKNTSFGESNNIVRILIKLILISLLIFVVILLVDKIEFPAPNKIIEKNIPNEKLKNIK